ncbi:acyl-CoA dehydrogenase family protein [Pseudorhodoferax sp. Leaf265]|uniref:acyl-CoA dehydrogenase family protein n=1 Tax=Pseudorhodoferax sp. Leaf265 TaxID=1736315 RepID=UPI0006FB9602|nr:acyl-CoA dehydrogenase family protein [Pseudorhodoferax sp. Leaf265]KQP19330.1 acyl-CoA dehydrogenase [Pseudorhodoferax sp. Leaf265]
MHQASWMNSDLETYRDSVRRFCERELLPNEKRWSAQGQVDREAWLKAGEAGLLCPGISGDYGGGGGNFLHEVVAFSEQVRLLCSGLGNAVHSGIVAHYIENFGTEHQKKRWLPKMATGELVAAIAMTEPGAGSDLQSIRTSAVRDSSHYIVNGAKTYISNGQLADLVCVVAKTDPAAGAKGISIVVVEVESSPGFQRGRALEKIGLHSQDTSELFFHDMRVPCDNLLGHEEGQGFRQLMKELPRERIIAAYCALGAMERAIEETLRFVSTRKVFGASLMEMQNTRFKLAECDTKAKMAGVFLDHCASLEMVGKLDNATAAMAKFWVTDACGQVVDECLQLHGGAGYMVEYPIARLYQNSRINRILAGSNEIMKELIARDLVKREL